MHRLQGHAQPQRAQQLGAGGTGTENRGVEALAGWRLHWAGTVAGRVGQGDAAVRIDAFDAGAKRKAAVE